MALEHEILAFSACLKTAEAMVRQESRDIALLDAVEVASSGVLMELQEQGWTCLRPRSRRGGVSVALRRARRFC
jgi:intracellular sulfur oxidation DsrE/DsrF family protein